MLDLKYIINNKLEVIKKLSTRNYDIDNIEKIVTLVEKRNKLIAKLEKLQAERNTLSDEIGIKKRNKQDTSKLMEKVSKIKVEIDKVDVEADELIKKVLKK